MPSISATSSRWRRLIHRPQFRRFEVTSCSRCAKPSTTAAERNALKYRALSRWTGSRRCRFACVWQLHLSYAYHTRLKASLKLSGERSCSYVCR
jgi:hypothetical protein